MQITTKGPVTIPEKSATGISIIIRMSSAKIDKRMTTDQIMELTRGYGKDDKVSQCFVYRCSNE